MTVRVVPRSKPKPAGVSAEGAVAKVDARSERWREHRKKVRSEIVDAAFRAIDLCGPEVSVREIAEEAGTAKPKIYPTCSRRSANGCGTCCGPRSTR